MHTYKRSEIPSDTLRGMRQLAKIGASDLGKVLSMSVTTLTQIELAEIERREGRKPRRGIPGDIHTRYRTGMRQILADRSRALQ